MNWTALARRRKKATRVAVCLIILVALLVLAVCHVLGIRSKMDVLAYYAMAQESYHPIWRDLALHRPRRGAPVENLVKAPPPVTLDEFPPYTVLGYSERGAFNVLDVIAKDGRLIAAGAAGCTWSHNFFETPAEREPFGLAHSQYTQQQLVEAAAYRIHLAITHGQSVFLSNRIRRQPVPEVNKPNQLRLVVEVTRVVHGDLEVGTRLEFSGNECREEDLNEPETVFLHFDDSRVAYPHSAEESVYLTIPKKALDWYQSLTGDQVSELERKALSRRRD
jgi:hypothetical protein